MDDLAGYDTASNAQANCATAYGYQGLHAMGRRLFAKGEAERIALQHVLASLDSGVTIEQLRAAIYVIDTHLSGKMPYSDPK